MKGDLIKDKFYLKEYDEGNYPYDNHLPYNLNTFGRYLVKSDILTINDYFQDNNCGIFTIELKECYLVYLVSQLDELYFKHTKSCLSRIENENIDIIDEKNILKHFLYDSEYQLYKGIDGFLNLNEQFIMRKLYFPKSKFSRKECEYWSHICLRLYVTFLNITKKIFENNKLKIKIKDYILTILYKKVEYQEAQ